MVSKNLIKTQLHFWISSQEINSWIDQVQFFFILAIGRSGTKLLANLLSMGYGAVVYHEPVPEDYQAYLRAYQIPKDSSSYINNFRKKEIYLRARRKKPKIYGEVNSLLRRHVVALKESFPNAILIHLIRDGREVVRSMMSRNTFSTYDKNTHGVSPKHNDQFINKWEEMDRFSRICWYWQSENAYLRENLPPAVKFEDIILNYDLFKEKILDPCSLDIPWNTWNNLVNQPMNKTRTHALPPWKEWSIERKKIFQNICAEEMKANGYVIKNSY